MENYPSDCHILAVKSLEPETRPPPSSAAKHLTSFS